MSARRRGRDLTSASSVHLEHLLTAVRRVADQASIRMSTTKSRSSRGICPISTGHSSGSSATSDGQSRPSIGEPDSAVDLYGHRFRARHGGSSSDELETQLLDQTLGHREDRRPCIDEGVVHLNGPNPDRRVEALFSAMTRSSEFSILPPR